MAKATIKPPTWRTSRCNVVGKEAVLQFLRNEVPELRRFADLAPQFAEALERFAAGPLVAKYKRTREELVKAADELQQAARSVFIAEERLGAAAGEGGDALATADTAHAQAFEHHARLKRREVLLREACQLAYLTVQSDLRDIGNKLSSETSRDAMTAIKTKQAELAELVSGHLDELSRLIDLQARATGTTFSVSQLRLEGPPEPLPMPAEDLLSVGVGPGVLRG